MTLPVWPHAESPFHSGELEAQRRAGTAAQLEAAERRVIRAQMPEQHRQFFAQLPFLVAAAVDAEGRPWASLLTGTPGFARALDAARLRIDAQAAPGDPIAAALVPGADIGLLGIELETRRRNRMNGVIVGADKAGITVAVLQSFGNCPRYIQQRSVRPAPGQAAEVAPIVSDTLDGLATAQIGRADTLFIATHHHDAPGLHNGGTDVSHRGGKPGFVGIDDAGRLLLPDFNGNAYFNTVGNLLRNPRAGLLFADFDSGDLLHVGVRAEVLWDGPLVARYAGAERVVRMTVEKMVRRPGALPLRAALSTPSPWLADTGEWPSTPAACDVA
ncbi:pyridoxamine 5'-phosphate oxidase family protein [Cupriavidus sp. AU9028]|uniref:pyridoxamine 5'-phosphate oxidase family protein n=1 Tax=Cupriavidus sp. AU9028 TaxID=2871157 RepID=UPI001C96C6CD|nr:pyridoxamine 5'-phosphate oxidase family protein [Cupriavidus sp. AU9028]MBY4898976.1 pyridoxamine 5'-phosphate oxidase family protein [Cupriavidus sp. AU9028]